MNYNLIDSDKTKNREINKFSIYIQGEWVRIIFASFAVLVNSLSNVLSPLLIGRIIDGLINNYGQVFLNQHLSLLVVSYLLYFFTNYLQILLMGRVGQNILFKLRETLFEKLQYLPISFFNENKSGDLISRINNDTDKLNQAFSETLIRSVSSTIAIIGVAISMLLLNVKLGLVAISVAVLILLLTKIILPKINRANKQSLESLGSLNGVLQENINNFRLLVAYNRFDYFLKNFQKENSKHLKNSIKANFYNYILYPFFDFAGNIAQIFVLLFGVNLLFNSEISLGLLIAFIAYVEKFYSPLRIFASLFASIETSLAAWNRIKEVLSFNRYLKNIKRTENIKSISNALLEINNVSFEYEKGKEILSNVNISFEKAKTYAIIGPTGGGKTTLASLISRLHDPTLGNITLDGMDLRALSMEQMTKRIGYILQEPIIFMGTIGDNIKYGNIELIDYDNVKLENYLINLGYESILKSFNNGLNTKVEPTGENISLGQKQIVAFLRVILRNPQILILDEATANIDTITEKKLQEILDKTSKEMIKIVIAHRLNTIKNADEIYFIAEGKVQKAVSYDKALEMVNNSRLDS